MRDFTLQAYSSLCLALKDRYQNITVSEYVSEAPRQWSNYIILRHDVDRFPARALKMAMLEHELGLRSTYYFRTVSFVFNKKVMRRIHDLGHEIGYHYETLAACKGNYSRALALFDSELKRLRQVVPVTTICMHGRPLSPWDNRDLWKKYDFRSFGIAAECYLTLDYDRLRYFSDTGRTWDPEKYNLRDKVNGSNAPVVRSTKELIEYLIDHDQQDVCILTHPNRWVDEGLIWGAELVFDVVVNGIKVLLKQYRKR